MLTNEKFTIFYSFVSLIYGFAVSTWVMACKHSEPISVLVSIFYLKGGNEYSRVFNPNKLFPFYVLYFISFLLDTYKDMYIYVFQKQVYLNDKKNIFLETMA